MQKGETYSGYSFVLSLGLHILGLLIFTYVGFKIEEKIEKITEKSLPETIEKRVYIELENEADKDKERDTIRKSLKNILETGQLTREEGIHIVGDENEYLTISTLLIDSSPKNKTKELKEKIEDKKELRTKDISEMVENIIEKARSGGFITENSLKEKFNVNKGDEKQLKLGSKQINQYPFAYNIIKKFKKNLALYLQYHDGFLTPETVVANLSVDREGNVSFNGFIDISEKQPKMNYLIRSSLESITKLPKEEMYDYPTEYQVVSMPVYLSFSGPPLNLFYFGIGNW